MKKIETKESIGIIAPPYWAIPSTDMTATEYLAEELAGSLNEIGKSAYIFSRKHRHNEKTQKCANYQYIYIGINHIWSCAVTKILKYLKLCLSQCERNYFVYILKTSFILRKKKIRKVIVFQMLDFCYLIKAINPDIKIIYHLGNFELSNNEKYVQFGYYVRENEYIERQFLSIYKIICVSEVVKKSVLDRFPYIKDKCVVIYPGLADYFLKKESNLNKKNISIFYAGRVVKEKGIFNLVAAFKLLKKNHPTITLNILGPTLGPQMDQMNLEFLKSEGINYYGGLKKEDVSRHLMRASIFVYPVVWDEPLGLAPLEALSMGIITIVTDGNCGYMELLRHCKSVKVIERPTVDCILNVLETTISELEVGTYLEKEMVDDRKFIKQILDWRICSKQVIGEFI